MYLHLYLLPTHAASMRRSLFTRLPTNCSWLRRATRTESFLCCTAKNWPLGIRVFGSRHCILRSHSIEQLLYYLQYFFFSLPDWAKPGTGIISNRLRVNAMLS
jgi:hypothetical protein